mgnify:CR=1 FL=1
MAVKEIVEDIIIDHKSGCNVFDNEYGRPENTVYYYITPLIFPDLKPTEAPGIIERG